MLSPCINGLIRGIYDGCIIKILPLDFIVVMPVKMKTPPLLVQNYFFYQTVMEIY